SSSAPSSPSPRKPESPHWSSRWPGSSSSSASPWWPWAGACARQTSGSRPTRIATVPTTAAATSSAARSSTEIRPPRRGLPHLNGSATRTSAIRTPAAGCPNRLHSHDRGIRVDCHSRFLCPCSPAPAHLARLARIASDLEFHVNSRRTASTVHQLFPTPGIGVHLPFTFPVTLRSSSLRIMESDPASTPDLRQEFSITQVLAPERQSPSPAVGRSNDRLWHLVFGALLAVTLIAFTLWSFDFVGRDAPRMVLITTVIFGAFMAFNIGGNDVANAFGTSVGAGTLTMKQALVVAAVFEVSGALLAGGDVTDTVKSGIVDLSAVALAPMDFAFIMMAARLGASVWLLVATRMGWPVSTTHA